jgi:hypothetical protein
MGCTCILCGRNKKFILNFGGKTLWKVTDWKTGYFSSVLQQWIHSLCNKICSFCSGDNAVF